MESWARLLDGYEATIVALEEALVAGDGPVQPEWRPPAAPPTAAATRKELARYTELQVRAVACEEQLRAAMTEAGTDLATVRRTGHAARAYGETGH